MGSPDAYVAVVGELIQTVSCEIEVVGHVLQIAGDAPIETGELASLGIHVVHGFPLGAVAVFGGIEGVPDRLHDISRAARNAGVLLDAISDAEEHEEEKEEEKGSGAKKVDWVIFCHDIVRTSKGDQDAPTTTCRCCRTSLPCFKSW